MNKPLTVTEIRKSLEEFKNRFCKKKKTKRRYNMKSLEQLIYELRKETENLSADQLFLRARGEHYAALGSKTNTAATEHEMKADVYRMLAREKKEKEV